MRLSAFIAVACLTLATDASVRFTEPVWRPDLGIAMPSLANAEAAPLRLPKAEAFLVTSTKGKRRLEDRFDVFDLWASATLRGRWVDVSGNELQIARLSTRPPEVAPGTVSTQDRPETP